MSEIKKKIIILLANYPENEFYGQEISRKIGCSKASTSNILFLLANDGFVLKKVRGHMKFYQINQSSLEVKKFKINLILEKLSSFVLKFEKISKQIILFGSASRGEQMFNSDIDIFILTDDKKTVLSEIKKINPKLKINAIIKNFSEWSEMEITNSEFYHEIKNGITLYNYIPRI